jgi:hypothetical protein
MVLQALGSGAPPESSSGPAVAPVAQCPVTAALVVVAQEGAQGVPSRAGAAKYATEKILHPGAGRHFVDSIHAFCAADHCLQSAAEAPGAGTGGAGLAVTLCEARPVGLGLPCTCEADAAAPSARTRLAPAPSTAANRHERWRRVDRFTLPPRIEPSGERGPDPRAPMGIHDPERASG